MLPVFTVSSTGATARSYPDILADIQNDYRSIYGSDIYIDNDSQDGQWLALLALGFYNTGQAALAAYNSFSPTTAQGAGLSSNVKLNGLLRDVSTNSTASVRCTGSQGVDVSGLLIGDNVGLNTQWRLPGAPGSATVVIPGAGFIDTTGTCTVQGDVAAAPATLTVILTPTLNFQSVTNAAAATEGAPVEDDATLRGRQSVSTAQPAQSPMASIVAEVGNVSGVQRFTGYENQTGVADANGVPGHSISIVAAGGAVQDIVNAIGLKKGPGGGTYGTTTGTYVDQKGISKPINFFVLALTPIYVSISIHPLPGMGYVSTTKALIQAAVADYLNNNDIGESVYYTKLFTPANLDGESAMNTTGMTELQLEALNDSYNITAMTIGTAPAPVGVADIPIAFNAAASGVIVNIVITEV